VPAGSKKEGTTCEVSKNLTGLQFRVFPYSKPVRFLETSQVVPLFYQIETILVFK